MSTKEDNKEYITPLTGDVITDEMFIKRSNQMIRAKQSSTLMEKKITVLAMSHMTIEKNKLVAKLSVPEIREALHYNGNGIYNYLKGISQSTVQHYMYLQEDPKKQVFDVIAVVERVEFRGGILKFTFNDAIRQHTIDVQKQFTIIPVSTLLSFVSNNTYRLYELFMTSAFKIPKGGSYKITYGLSELKFAIGLIDVNDPYVARNLQMRKTYDEIINAMPHAPYKEYNNFKTRLLNVAQKELNDSDEAEIRFTYEPVRSGHGGKITSICFTIYKKENAVIADPHVFEKESIVTNENVRELMAYSEGKITNNDAILLLEHAKNDLEKVKAAYDAAMKRRGIRNWMGWVMSALDGDWDIKPVRKKTGFSNFQEREYDYDKLEQDLLNSQD